MPTAPKRQIRVSADKVAICRRDDAKNAPMLLLEQCELLEAPVQVVALVVPRVAVPMDLSIKPERKTEQRGQSTKVLVREGGRPRGKAHLLVSPRVGQMHSPILRLHVGESVEDVRELLGRDVLR